MLPIRVVVVEDFLPFRRFVCKILAKLPEVNPDPHSCDYAPAGPNIATARRQNGVPTY